MSAAADFQPGDVVQLKSGGPEMTVKDVTTDLIRVMWYRGRDQEFTSDEFPPQLIYRTKER